MKNTYFLFIALLSNLILGSCAFHSGNISTGYMPDCPVTEIATRTSSTFHILGLGGLDKNALILEAKKDLFRNFKVTNKIKISNFSVDFRTTWVLIFFSTKCTVSADVFDCNQKFPDASKPEGIPLTVKGFMKGDTIFYNPDKVFPERIDQGIITVIKDKYAVIQVFSVKKSAYKLNVTYEEIFKITKSEKNKSLFGHELGELVETTVYSPKNGAISKTCIIVGLGSESVIISYQDDSNRTRMIAVKKALLGK